MDPFLDLGLDSNSTAPCIALHNEIFYGMIDFECKVTEI